MGIISLEGGSTNSPVVYLHEFLGRRLEDGKSFTLEELYKETGFHPIAAAALLNSPLLDDIISRVPNRNGKGGVYWLNQPPADDLWVDFADLESLRQHAGKSFKCPGLCGLEQDHS